MKIQRNRFAVMRRNRTEIWCGLAREFPFKPVDQIGETSIKTYRTRKQAESGCSSRDRNFEVVPVVETIEMMGDAE